MLYACMQTDNMLESITSAMRTAVYLRSCPRKSLRRHPPGQCITPPSMQNRSWLLLPRRYRRRASVLLLSSCLVDALRLLLTSGAHLLSTMLPLAQRCLWLHHCREACAKQDIALELYLTRS
jgi:hypothetical protein